MDRAKILRSFAAYVALAVCAEVYLGLAWCAHSGWLPMVGGVGPVSVMVIEETSDRNLLTSGQLDIINSNAADGLRVYLKDHGEKDPFRLVDKDDSMSQEPEKWQTAFTAKGDSVPWLVIERGGRVLKSEPLPKDAAETMRTIKRYGGG